jgi:hypothetical protein
VKNASGEAECLMMMIVELGGFTVHAQLALRASERLRSFD